MPRSGMCFLSLLFFFTYYCWNWHFLFSVHSLLGINAGSSRGRALFPVLALGEPRGDGLNVPGSTLHTILSEVTGLCQLVMHGVIQCAPCEQGESPSCLLLWVNNRANGIWCKWDAYRTHLAYGALSYFSLIKPSLSLSTLDLQQCGLPW